MRFGPLGLPEIIIILVIVLLVFGPRRLPEMAKGIGQSVREFRKGIRDMKDEITGDDDEKANKSSNVSTAKSEAAQSTTTVTEKPTEKPAEKPAEKTEVNA